MVSVEGGLEKELDTVSSLSGRIAFLQSLDMAQIHLQLQDVTLTSLWCSNIIFFKPLTTNDHFWHRQILAACYQLTQSVLKIVSALAERVGHCKCSDFLLLNGRQTDHLICTCIHGVIGTLLYALRIHCLLVVVVVHWSTSKIFDWHCRRYQNCFHATSSTESDQCLNITNDRIFKISHADTNSYHRNEGGVHCMRQLKTGAHVNSHLH